jgi:hypothetical protein
VASFDRSSFNGEPIIVQKTGLSGLSQNMRLIHFNGGSVQTADSRKRLTNEPIAVISLPLQIKQICSGMAINAMSQ